MEEENKTPKESSIVFKKSLEENHKTNQVDEKNDFLVVPLETDNRKEKGMIKRLEETQKRERRKNEDLEKEPLASHIKRGKWNNALLEACEIGNKEIVELMIEKGADDWNYGLRSACFGGNKEIVELMIEKGANDWNWGLIGACQGGNKVSKYGNQVALQSLVWTRNFAVWEAFNRSLF